jgi:hypothetical protein
MSEEQEARLLQNQALIMRALRGLYNPNHVGSGYMRGELDIRIKDIEAFLKADQPA